MPKRIAAALGLAAAVNACMMGARPLPVPEGGNTYTAQVDTYLARLAATYRERGYGRTVARGVYGALRDDETGSHTMDVVAGNEYALMGACDNDCTDLDLKIYDQDNTLLMQDVAVDDTPVLRFTANSSGSYRVVVIMAACNRSPCYYGIQLMAR
jgi:hypothetical protein